MRIYNQTETGIAIDVDGVDMTLKNLTTKAQSVATGKSDVELMNLELSTVNEFELSKFTVTADSLTGLEEVYVYVDGSEYDELTSTSQIFKDDTFTVTAKKPLNIKVIGSIADTATD
jgi:TPP-dependent trihydroxycyclohexane-1,2-dione (THcHDO) dehydratase